ncbi:hypothetical protein OBK14_09320 [Empedobacter falsenii]
MAKIKSILYKNLIITPTISVNDDKIEYQSFIDEILDEYDKLYDDDRYIKYIKYDINGDIIEMVQSDYHYKFEKYKYDESDEYILSKNTYTYDSNRRLVYRVKSHNDSKYITNYIYDNNDNLVEKINIQGDQITRAIFEYNENNQLLKYSDDKYIINCEYDELNRLIYRNITTKEHNNDCDFIDKEEKYTYSNNGDITIKYFEFRHIEKYKVFDKWNRLIIEDYQNQETSYEDEEPQYLFHYFYEDNLIVDEIAYKKSYYYKNIIEDEDGDYERKVIKDIKEYDYNFEFYDSLENEYCFDKSRINYTISFKYNENKDLIEKKHIELFDFDNKIYIYKKQYEYEYDINNNWIKRNCLFSGKSISRKIEYY